MNIIVILEIRKTMASIKYYCVEQFKFEIRKLNNIN
jgi:hypothetical protein